MDEENNTIDDLYQAYADAAERGDNTSIISQAIKAEEQGLAGSDAWNRAAADQKLPAGIVATDPAQEFVKDLGRGATQLGLETVGGINRLMPALEQLGIEDGTADKDYYGWSIGDEFTARDLMPNFFKEAFMSNDYEGGITIPIEQYSSNPRFADHMKELEMYAHYSAARDISKELSDALKVGQQSQNYEAFNQILNTLKDQAIADEDLALKLQNFEDGTWRIASVDESGENIIINKLPQVDEGFFGFDMTLDPQFTSKGDLSLPGEGVFGMRDGKLVQLASSVSRPLDEMLMDNSPGAEYAAKNITDKLAFQGPEMMPPEGAGIGYMLPMFFGIARGVGVPAAKGAYKVGKKGYNFAKGSPTKNVEKIEPYLYEGILQNIK
jgi:hypothetical protein